MKSTTSKKLIVGKGIGIISAIWILFATLFHLFGHVIWGYLRPPWVGQFIFIGIVLIIAWVIIIGITLLTGKLSKRAHCKG